MHLALASAVSLPHPQAVSVLAAANLWLSVCVRWFQCSSSAMQPFQRGEAVGDVCKRGQDQAAGGRPP
jgi:hypothetical protein